MNKYKLAVLLILVSMLFSKIALAFDGLVTSIHDGDTLTVVNELGFEEKIRLAKADTPELAGTKWGYQPYASNARSALLNLCSGKIAKVTRISKDQYGRTLGKVICADIDVASYLIENGDAWAYRYSSTKSLRAKQALAKSNNLGLWALPNPIEPMLWRKNRMKTL